MSLDFWNRWWFERYAPLGVAFITFAAGCFFRAEIGERFSPNGWSPNDLYNVIFNWSSIQSGFVFAIYGFIVTKRDGFAGKLVGGQTYERFLSFTKRACFGGFALTIASMPLVVAAPRIDPDALYYLAIVAWFSLFIWAFCAFMRVAFSFGVIVATPDKPDQIPG